MKTLPRNVTPFMLEGWPLDALDQTTMARLRRLEDRTGCTVAEHMHEAMEQFLARRKAKKELETKIIRFPSPMREAYQAPDQINVHL